MGIADLVPGVSGGTVVFSLGLYEKLLNSINTFRRLLASLIRFETTSAKIFFSQLDWFWIITLSFGALTGVFLFGNVIKNQLESNPILVASLFHGFVCAAVIFAYRSIGDKSKTQIAFIVSSATIVFIFLGIFDSQKMSENGHIATWVFFISGIVAICAMLLPGISGSLILIIMGLYQSILTALVDVQISIIITFILGVIVGVFAFAKLITWTLNKYYFYVMSILIGFMAGSLRILWPWPNGIDDAILGRPDNNILLAILFWFKGFLLISTMHLVSFKLINNGSKN